LRSSSHVTQEFSNDFEDSVIFHAGVRVVEAGGVDDHDGLFANFSINDTDFAGARLKISSNLLML